MPAGTSYEADARDPGARLGSRFQDALHLAADLHARQVRKGTRIPYLAHLLAVASLALENGADEDTAIAALLHDAVEDQGGAATLGVIRERFGDRVARIVAECSDTDTVPKPPWRERKEAYVAHLPHADAATRLVSACDKLHNARSILEDLRRNGLSVFERFKGGKDGTLWYYRTLVEIFRRTGSPRRGELERGVGEMERLAGETE